jgi:hypothetical protein
MLVDFGAMPLLALAAALVEAALALSPLAATVPMMMINDPASAHSRAHRLPIDVLPGVSPERTTTRGRLRGASGDGPRASAQSSFLRALQTSYCLAEVFVNLYPASR